MTAVEPAREAATGTVITGGEPAGEPAGGTIITFYSYKGGTGRTMALANIAWILAQGGKKVLAVDWDLESPGLHKFFQPFLDNDIVADHAGNHRAHQRLFVGGHDETASMVPAGIGICPDICRTPCH